jgi:hypothetical protein
VTVKLDELVRDINLKPNPEENANVILGHHNTGLLAWLGRQWVCVGKIQKRVHPVRDNFEFMLST